MADDEALNEEDLNDSLEDLSVVQDWADGAVLWSTDWTAETILSQLHRFNIDLDPTFQRRSAWTDKKQSLFIESLILGLPIPQVILAENKGKKGSFIVIDGKQRLLSIRRFGTTDNASDFTPLKLQGLRELERLNGKTYADLIGDDSFSEDRSALENASVRTIVIRNWKNEEYLYEVFLRINTGSVQLSPQELRQALHPGPMSAFVGSASAESTELKMALSLKAPDFRMRDAEIVLRYIAYKNYMTDYNGNLKHFLDETTRKLNAEWDTREGVVREQVAEMEQALSFTRSVFGEKDYLRKWNGTVFESRTNRAVIDIMLHFFSDRDIRAALDTKKEELKNKFKELCGFNDNFRSSIESTTKSITSNKIRFNTWADAINEISGISVTNFKFPG
jgi:hypothetical protein